MQVKGLIENGKIKILNKRILQHIIKQYKDGQQIVMTIKPLQRRRTLQQNAYWWGACYPVLAELTGHTVNEIHEICKEMFIKPEFITVNKKIPVGKFGAENTIQKPKSTTNLSVNDGVIYTENLRQLALELGGYIPTPEEAGYII